MAVLKTTVSSGNNQSMSGHIPLDSPPHNIVIKTKELKPTFDKDSEIAEILKKKK